MASLLLTVSWEAYEDLELLRLFVLVRDDEDFSESKTFGSVGLEGVTWSSCIGFVITR